MDYDVREYAEMLMLYGECKRDAQATVVEYGVRYPNRRQPTVDLILSLLKRLRETGRLIPNPLESTTRVLRGRTVPDIPHQESDSDEASCSEDE